MEENKLPTAEEWLTSFGADADDMFYKHSVEEAMIEFAKMHVEAAIKSILENVTLSDDKWDSILNAYPLTNIK